jgi:hypothetical protein
MNDKIFFLRNNFPQLLLTLNGNEKGKWGVLNAHQMIEHMADAFMAASKKIILPQLLKGEQMEKSQAFMLSDKPFKENTDNPLLPKEPPSPKSANVPAAVEKLIAEINYFIDVYETGKVQTTINPFFGELNFEQSVHLLHKHAIHHLKQFSLI